MKAGSKEQVKEILQTLKGAHKKLQKLCEAEADYFLTGATQSEDCTGKYIDIINDGLEGMEKCQLILGQLLGT